MTGMDYEEKETVLAPGRHPPAALGRHRRGARPPGRDVRLPAAEGGGGAPPGGGELIDWCSPTCASTPVPGREQEDDITLSRWRGRRDAERRRPAVRDRQLVEFEVASAEGNERLALARVGAIVAPLRLSEARLKRLRDCGRRGDDERDGARQRLPSDLSVTVRVLTDADDGRACRSPTTGERPADGRSRGARPRGQARGAAAAAWMGAVPHQRAWSTRRTSPATASCTSLGSMRRRRPRTPTEEDER